MPWKDVSLMSQRRELVHLLQADSANVSELCRRFGVSRKTAYKWRDRFRAPGLAGLADRVRTPHQSPGRCPAAVEAAVLSLRDRHPAWGGRKLRQRLLDLEHTDVPSASTITAILRRHDRLDSTAAAQRAPLRFEQAAPNQLWQMDFKGHFAMADQRRCHPLTVIDDHSRFNLALSACGDEQFLTVQANLTAVFRRYGLPERILCDNGPPWGCGDGGRTHSVLTVWLLRLGVATVHGRPYHPQTQGKDERFHRTLTVEVLQTGPPFADLAVCQRRFDDWRTIYNHERPHEALGLAVPASRYRPSPRAFPETLPPLEYLAGDAIRRVSVKGTISYGGRTWRVGHAFRGEPVAVRAAAEGVWTVHFGRHAIATLDLQTHNPQ